MQKMKNMDTKNFFIQDEYINRLLEDATRATDAQINDILDRAERFEGLRHQDVAALLQTENPVHIQRINAIAEKIKKHIYGERVVMFAPLYVSDYCINRCDYCGFRCDNQYHRVRLTMDQVRKEVEILERMGHKRLALEAGEDPKNCPIEYVLECMQTIYDMKFENGEIRRVNVNIAATTVEEYKMLHDIGIGTYILFQETYHRDTYEKVHVSGPKSDYFYHSTAFDRAMQGGIDDVGGGVLFGLYDYRYEVLGLMLHNEHLEKTFGVGFHTISVPRLCEAPGNDLQKYPHIVTDEQFKKIVAVIRLAVPFTGMIVSTRETPEIRREVLRLGISQVSGGSSVEVGGYTAREEKGSQFSVSDNRSARDVIFWLMEEDVIPSFCTACYRKERTGDRFMALAKSGNIKNVCLPNALLTLKEYSLDYGDPEFTEKAEAMILRKLPTIENDKVRSVVEEKLAALEQGQRDLFL